MELCAVLILITAPTFAYLGCSLFWGDEYQTIRDRRSLESRTETAVEVDLFESMIVRLRLVPIILFVIWRSGEAWSRFGLVKPAIPKDVVIGLGVWLIVAFFTSLIALAFGRHNPWLSFQPFAVPPVRAMLLVGESCAVGFSEELALRAYLIPRLEAMTGSTRKSILLSSLIFGFAHLNKSYVGVIFSIVTAIVFGIAFSLTRRIWPVAIAHAFGDFIVGTHLRAAIRL